MGGPQIEKKNVKSPTRKCVGKKIMKCENENYNGLGIVYG